MKTRATIAACLLPAALAGCGIPFSESASRSQGYYVSAEPMAKAQLVDLGVRLWERSDSGYHPRLESPRVVPGPADLAPFPLNALVQVEVLQPPRPCVPSDPPVRDTIWILLSRPPGSPAFISTGPEWLGLLLRAAGPGGEVVIPAKEPCDAGSLGAFNALPRRVFAMEGGGTMALHDGREIQARVLQACTADPSVESYAVTSYQVPMFGYRTVPWRVRRDRTTMRVRAHCAKGEVAFSYGPVTSASPLDPRHDPRPEVASSGNLGR